MNSYDPRMENLPLLISYPRSGSHWLNGLMELYFDRPRLRQGPASWFPNRHDFMWFHDHDIHSDLKIGHDKVMYLIRDPKDVIFSLLKAEHNEITNVLVVEQIARLQRHYHKYLNIPSCNVISYHNMKLVPHEEFTKVTSWLDQAYVPIALDRALQMVSKSKVIDKAVDKRYFHKGMLSSSYEDERKQFKDAFGDMINTSLLNESYLHDLRRLLDV
jgi:hypothetical protein